jgi:hypothetical protein
MKGLKKQNGDQHPEPECNYDYQTHMTCEFLFTFITLGESSALAEHPKRIQSANHGQTSDNLQQRYKRVLTHFYLVCGIPPKKLSLGLYAWPFIRYWGRPN